MMGAGVGMAAGALVGGELRDLTGNFDATMGLSLALSMIGVISIIMLPTTKKELLPNWEDQLPEENGPSGEGKPSEKDPIDPSDSGSEGKPQSHDLGTGTDAGDDDLENASPEAKTFMKNLLEPGDTVDEIMMKKPEDLTEGEVREIMIARMDATTEDERERLFKAEKGFFDHFFGNEPAGTDAVGRTM